MTRLRDDLACAIQLRAFVRGSDHRAQARFALGHGGKSNRWNVHARVVQSPRKFKGLRALSDMDRRDGRFGRAGGKAQFLQAALEKFRVGPQLFQQLFALRGIEQREGRLARGHHGWRMSR